MAATNQQIQQALEIIEAQLRFLKTSLGGPAPLPTIPASTEEGVVGIFDGEFMTLPDGKRLQVPPNYASKSMLVPGDTLRMVEDPSKDPAKAKFKQIGKVERVKTSGLLTKKDGKFEVLTELGSFKVLSAAIKHYLGEAGDTVAIHLPQNYTKGSYAAVEKVLKGAGSAPSSPPQPTPTHSEPASAVASTPQAQPVANQQTSEAGSTPNPARPKSSSNSAKPNNSSAKSKNKGGQGGRGGGANNGQRPPRPASATTAPGEIALGQAPSGEIDFSDPLGEDDLV